MVISRLKIYFDDEFAEKKKSAKPDQNKKSNEQKSVSL